MHRSPSYQVYLIHWAYWILTKRDRLPIETKLLRNVGAAVTDPGVSSAIGAGVVVESAVIRSISLNYPFLFIGYTCWLRRGTFPGPKCTTRAFIRCIRR